MLRRSVPPWPSLCRAGEGRLVERKNSNGFGKLRPRGIILLTLMASGVVVVRVVRPLSQAEEECSVLGLPFGAPLAVYLVCARLSLALIIMPGRICSAASAWGP